MNRRRRAEGGRGKEDNNATTREHWRSQWHTAPSPQPLVPSARSAALTLTLSRRERGLFPSAVRLSSGLSRFQCPPRGTVPFSSRRFASPPENRDSPLLHPSSISFNISASTFGFGSPSAVAINSFGTRRIKGRISA